MFATILEACDRAVREAQKHVLIPRRFSLGLREMFALQPRLEHPRGTAHAARARASALSRRLRSAAAARAVGACLRRSARTGGSACRKCRRRGARGDGHGARQAAGRRPRPAGARRGAAPAPARAARRRYEGVAVNVWQPVYIGVGSNVDDPRRAGATWRSPGCTRFAAHARRQRLRRSMARGRSAHCAAGLCKCGGRCAHGARIAGIAARELQALERALGRPARHQKWGPRVIDLDLLVYGSEHASGGSLELPHPGIARAQFRAAARSRTSRRISSCRASGAWRELAARARAGTGLWPL